MITYLIIGITVILSFICFSNRELFMKLAFKSRKTKRDGCEKRNAFFLSKTKCASNLIRKATVHLQNQSKTPSFH